MTLDLDQIKQSIEYGINQIIVFPFFLLTNIIAPNTKNSFNTRNLELHTQSKAIRLDDNFCRTQTAFINLLAVRCRWRCFLIRVAFLLLLSSWSRASNPSSLRGLLSNSCAGRPDPAGPQHLGPVHRGPKMTRKTCCCCHCALWSHARGKQIIVLFLQHLLLLLLLPGGN